MNSRREQLSGASELPKRGRLLLLVLFWALAFLVCVNVRALLGRLDLPPMWTQLKFFGCMLVVYVLLWTGERWARRSGVVVFLFWAVVFLWPAIISGPYLAPLVHFTLAGLLLFLAVALIYSESVAQFLDSRRRADGRAFNVSDIAPAIQQVRQDYIAGPRVGLRGARFRRILLAVTRRSISGLAFFRKADSLRTGTNERERNQG
jgi:hypothetical protein